MTEKFPSFEKLKGNKRIEFLFAHGKSVKNFPLMMVYVPATELKIGVSVSKRNFKKAVDRNRVKRLMREVVRKNKKQGIHVLPHKYHSMLIYIGKELPEYNSLAATYIQLVEKLSPFDLPSLPQD